MTLPEASVCLDVQGAQNRAHFDRGIPRYITEQARALVELAPEAFSAISLNPARPLTGNLNWLLGSGRLEWHRGPGRAPSRLPAIFHAMSPFELDRGIDELWPLWARGQDVRTVVTLFDLIPLVFRDHYLRSPAIRNRYLARADFVRRADVVLAISETTAEDAVRLLGVDEKRVTVIDAGVSNHFAEASGDRGEAARIVERRFPALRRGFMLYVAGIEYRKNIERLITAHGLTTPEFRERHQLVITCRMQPEAEGHLRSCARAAGLSGADLILTNYVADAELAALYRTCELFVFASFYEGSGLPILEAMACGVPVAAANTSTFPEILGDRRATFDPFDVEDIARVLQQTLADPKLLAALRERSRDRVSRYTWQHVAARSVHGYEQALGGSRRRRAGRSRARIALYSPWPPDHSGIAAYNRRLVQELGRHADVDVVVGKPTTAYGVPQEPRTRLMAGSDGEWMQPLRNPDRIVYCMGNSDFHGYVYEALRRRPGAVVAHDVRLTGFYGWYAGRERPGDPVSRLSERIDAVYGHRLGAGLFADAPPTPDQQSALGIYMSQEIQEYAERIAVHSEYARDILRLDGPFERRGGAPVTVLPLACPTRSSRAPRIADPEAPLIASFGVVSSVKHPQVLIEAFALLAADRPGARLVFAGHGDPAELERWRGVARKLGLEHRVELPGHVTDAEWEATLARTDVAVQLRLVSNGEASAAVVDCLSAGVPTVVSDEGWSAELPDEAVVKVPQAVTARGLASALAEVIDDPDRAGAIADGGLSHSASNSFAIVTQRYLEWLELP